jgi:hypothetical protein
MRLVTLAALALGCAWSLLAGHAAAWGPAGHRMVGEIAQRHLTDRTVRQIETLLKYDRLADGTPSNRRTLGEIANWADEIRDQPWSAKYANWHFDNIPVCGDTRGTPPCRYGNCASARLAQQLELLGNPGKSRRVRNEALKWVVHLAADIHQPLHAADNRDRGGNAIEVDFFGVREGQWGALNLHTIWDEQLVARRVAELGGEAAVVGAPIAPLDKAAWEAGAIGEWIAESNELARITAYGKIPGFQCGAHIVRSVSIGDDYYSAAAPIIEQQIRRAGVRLAMLLNAALDKR